MPVSSVLRSWWSRVRAGAARIPAGSIEVAYAALLSVPILLTTQQYVGREWYFALEIAICAAGAVFGRFPRAMTAVLVVLVLAGLGAGEDFLFALLVLLGPITSAGARGLRSARLILTVLFLVGATVQESLSAPHLMDLASRMVFWVTVLIVALAAGQGIRSLLQDRTRLLADRTAAVQSQRRSIARDLHDTIAYSTTSIILRAEQAKLRGVSDADLAADLDYIIAAGRNSMRDLRGMMETLRRNDPDVEVQPSAWEISSLSDVLQTREADLREHGFAVTRHVEADLTALPESVRETLAKVVVEATSNMIKHGDPAAGCSIMIEADEEEVEAVFINKPAPASHERPTLTSQLGLVGARERVEALGGSIEIASKSPTWVVQVRLPQGR